MMVGKILTENTGLTHKLFKDDEESPEAAEGDPEAEKPAVDKDDILNQMKYKFVEEVVTEKKLHYWDVPRLGSFMAIPLNYRSCLSEMSLDKAMEEYIEILKQQEEQDKLKGEWQEEQDAER